MDTKTLSFKQSRRRFLSGILPVGTLVCSGCSNVPILSGSKGKTKVLKDQHKFLKDSGMSFTEVYEFAYKKSFIPIMQNLADNIGRDNFIDMLKKASSETTAQIGRKMAQDLSNNPKGRVPRACPWVSTLYLSARRHPFYAMVFPRCVTSHSH